MAATNEQGDSKPMLGDRRKKGHRKYELVEETTCGIGCFRHDFLQRFANQKSYVFLYGFMGLILSAAYSYFNGTITTIEKRFQIPSRVTGIISVGNDMSTLLVGAIITYYAGKGHRPRWIAAGLYTVVLFCILTALPHFLYGPGEDALSLTMEYGGRSQVDQNVTQDALDKFHKQTLCQNRTEPTDSGQSKDGMMVPAMILFLAQFISGIGGSLYFTLGVTYMDDNAKKSNAPALVSFSYTIRMLGPAIGYSLSSLCLKYYIAPSLTPKITNTDPRWLGAWWVGWLLLATVMFIVSSLLGLFPHTLPKAYLRKQMSAKSNESKQDEKPDKPASLKDMYQTFKRLVQNKVFICSNVATVFFFFGYMPYWMFLPKYIETVYKTTASEASLVTGAVGLVFSAIGVMIGGLTITKFKPKARTLAGWNMIVAAISAVCLMSYTWLGCPNTRDPKGFQINDTITYVAECNAGCSCDYVKYTPVCAYGESYISPCHAGCRNYLAFPNGTKIYTDCGCVNGTSPDGTYLPQIATSGPCKADCTMYFYAFLAVICFLKFTSATARTSNFLISVRCVETKDKPASMGFSATVYSLFAFIPSPIFFGYLIDTQCLVWGKTSSGKGNCWLYDADSLIYVLNVTAACFVFTGLLFDFGVWYYVKGIPIFDEEEKEEIGPDQVVSEKEMEFMKNGKAKNEPSVVETSIPMKSEVNKPEDS